MFTTLETTWDQSTRRGWTTFASFAFQAMALSLLMAVPLVWVEGPPRLEFLERLSLPVPPGPAAPAPPQQSQRQTASPSNFVGRQLMQPSSIPTTTAVIRDAGPITPPDIPGDVVRGGIGSGRGNGVFQSLGTAMPIMIERPAAAVHPLKISHWAEGNLIYRVQPVYPLIAREARVQGPVELRAIISKTGAIENLTAISGHPALISAAIAAVRQWRYRPYLLNDEPYPVETDITVNFVLAGN